MTPHHPSPNAARAEASPPPGDASPLGHTGSLGHTGTLGHTGSLGQAAGGSAGGGAGFSSSFGLSLAVHGALVATLALTLRPWATPSDTTRGHEFLAQFSAPAPQVEPEPSEELEVITPDTHEAELPEEPLVLPEEPAPPIEVSPPRAAAPTTSNLLESVVFPRLSGGRESDARDEPAVAVVSAPPAAVPSAAAPSATVPPRPVPPEPEEEPPGAESAPSSPEPLEGLCVPPAYPQLAARRGWTGTVVLLVEVSADGSVNSVSVETTSGHALLDDAALRAVKGWRFAPARLAGVPATATVRKPIRFGDA